MSMNRGMLKYIPVYPSLEALQSHDENTGEPYGPTWKMSRTGCLRSWLQGNMRSMIPFLENKTRTPTGCVCECFQGHALAGEGLAVYTPNCRLPGGCRVRCRERIRRNTRFLLCILLCLISFHRTLTLVLKLF